jgi:thioredoxin-dependent peroxiredoxin
MNILYIIFVIASVKLPDMKTFLTILSFLAMASFNASAQQSLSVGDKAPLFKAVADDGSTWDLSKQIGKDYIVLYFYPGAMTGGCTKQACAYRDKQSDLNSVDATVVGISGDKVENLKLFKKAENLNFTLLSDEKGDIARSFGVPVSDGSTFKKTIGESEFEIVRDVTARRWTFIVDKSGKIIYKNDAVNAEKDSEEVIAFLKKQS